MKVLFFSPIAFFSVHSVPEALVADALTKAGHEVVFVRCDGLFKRCCLAMSDVPFEDEETKSRRCDECRASRDSIAAEFKLPSLAIEEFLLPEEASRAAQATRELTPNDYLEFKIDGIPLGKFALYEFWLNHKLSSANIPPALWPEYLARLHNVLLAFYAMRRVLAYHRPDRVVTYNSLYSLNRTVCSLADTSNIPHFMLHAGRHHKFRLQQMTVFKGIANYSLINRLPTAEKYRAIPCTTKQVDIINEHVRELLNATSLWVYSIKSDKSHSQRLLDHFGIRAGQKVLLAIMRSGDERLAAGYAGVEHFEAQPIFSDQYEWLTWLIEYARANSEYSIIFRVHPREFPNKREQVTSQNAVRFSALLKDIDLPENFHVNLPEDQLSLHDLFKITDVVLNNTSTAALEASLFGIPVVGIGDEVFGFDLSLQEEPASIPEYIEKIRVAASQGWSFARVIAAYRWLNYVNSEVSIDISDGYRPSDLSARPWVRFAGKLERVAKRKLGLKPGLPEVRGRPAVLKNAAQLTYAIINDDVSHIGIYPVAECADERLEARKIAEAYQSLMNSIRNSDDALFLSKYSRLVS
ncbi:hypothetical protein [Bradyrhizobium erythrophlei]|uniref:Capsule polysaccharide biosynthesis protein n=1 Tax=Bradyrhizobium erythrophlei TaxID=1437360 RepID=A0A1M7UHM4_9BRAD|nr:hypothetical protein [Bradyrhizobium erythrophlei]SHN82377.1 hypothetical protein SAMN05444170_5094 [Bradyrhizobium erythrophlei]